MRRRAGPLASGFGLALDISRIVRAASGAMDQEIVHLIQLRAHQNRAASPAGVVNSVAAGLEDWRGTQDTSHPRGLDSPQRNLPPLSHYVPYAHTNVRTPEHLFRRAFLTRRASVLHRVPCRLVPEWNQAQSDWLFCAQVNAATGSEDEYGG